MTVFLMLHLASFTPDVQITVRELFIPFQSAEVCEDARARILIGQSIGKAVDSAACVTFPNPDDVVKLKSFPNR